MENHHKTTLQGALAQEKPLQIVGAVNAFSALLAKRAGFKALYLSGAGVANASYGLPDLGITTMDNVLEDVYRITNACDLPLLVDCDTGFGGALQIARTVKSMIKAGACGIHLEDQINNKRCGHRPRKELVDSEEMCDRLKAAVDARYDANFVLMARTDALEKEGLEKTIARILQYVATGADMIFFEGATTLAQYQAVTKICPVPVLANITEFGVTPLFSKEELAQIGISLILYPLSAFRAMNKAAQAVYQAIRADGTQKKLLSQMLTRDELYAILDYYAFEKKLDQLYVKGKM